MPPRSSEGSPPDAQPALAPRRAAVPRFAAQQRTIRKVGSDGPRWQQPSFTKRPSSLLECDERTSRPRGQVLSSLLSSGRLGGTEGAAGAPGAQSPLTNFKLM
jgi:hypothetical protein